MLREPKPLTQRGQDFTAARMHDPAGDLLSTQAALLERVRQHSLRVLSRKTGHLLGKNVSRHSPALLEAQIVAIDRTQRGRRHPPLDLTAVGLGLARQDDRSSTVTKQTAADEHAGIVIQIESGAAHFYTDRKHFL